MEVNEQVGCLEKGDARKTLSKGVALEAKTAWIYVIWSNGKQDGSDMNYLQVRRSTAGGSGHSQTLVNIAVEWRLRS